MKAHIDGHSWQSSLSSSLATADVDLQDEEELTAACAALRVQLVGKYRMLDRWVHTLMNVPGNMVNARSFYTKGYAPKNGAPGRDTTVRICPVPALLSCLACMQHVEATCCGTRGPAELLHAVPCNVLP